MATSFVNIRNPFTGVRSAAVYPIALQLGDRDRNYWLPAMDLIVAGTEATEILIGRDVIDRGELLWWGPDKEFTLALPL